VAGKLAPAGREMILVVQPVVKMHVKTSGRKAEIRAKHSHNPDLFL